MIGYIGSSTVAVSAPLQLHKSWQSGSTGDISWKWMLSYLFGVCLIFVYAIIEDLPPVWGPGLLEMSSSIMLLILKIKYDLIQHKTYAVEMSTQTDPADFADSNQTDKLEIECDVAHNIGSELKKYVSVSSERDI